MINEPKVRLRVGHQHSWYLSILTHFMDYYTPFCGPKAISGVVKPQSVLTCWLLRLVVWADSGPFLGLLLSFGSRSYSMIDESRCAFTVQS